VTRRTTFGTSSTWSEASLRIRQSPALQRLHPSEVEYPEIDGPRKGIGTLQKVVSWEGRTHSRGPGSLVSSGNPVGQAPPRVRRTHPPPAGTEITFGAEILWCGEASLVGRSLSCRAESPGWSRPRGVEPLQGEVPGV
jgi:hypothetical protein